MKLKGKAEKWRKWRKNENEMKKDVKNRMMWWKVKIMNRLITYG